MQHQCYLSRADDRLGGLTKPQNFGFTLLSTVLLIVGGYGCSAVEPNGQDTPSETVIKDRAAHARDLGQHEIYDALKDGAATKEEYEDGFQRFVECVASRGYQVVNIMTSPIDGLRKSFGVQPGSADPAVAFDESTKCQDETLTAIEISYVETHPNVMDPALRSAVSTCLSNARLPVPAQPISLTDFRDAAGKANEEQVNDCVAKASAELFPDASVNL